MVKSALHTKIEYAETRRMDPEDKAHDTVVYLCDILSDEVFYHMTLGKEHNDFSHYGVYYYPIYLISEKRKAILINSHLLSEIELICETKMMILIFRN